MDSWIAVRFRDGQEIRGAFGESGAQARALHTLSRKAAESTADGLRRLGIRAAAYHAGLEPDERTRVQDAFIRDDIDVFGVEKLADSGLLIRARVKTEPSARWSVGREFNRRIIQGFEARGIKIPRPQPMVMVERAPPKPPEPEPKSHFPVALRDISDHVNVLTASACVLVLET